MHICENLSNTERKELKAENSNNELKGKRQKGFERNGGKKVNKNKKQNKIKKEIERIMENITPHLGYE